MALKALFVDHHDSFSENLINWLECLVDIQIIEVLDSKTSDLQKKWLANKVPVIFSPGPGKPDHYEQSKELLAYAKQEVPIFGVCLGHQIISSYLGFEILRGKDVMHGLAQKVRFDAASKSFFQQKLRLVDCSEIEAGFYNSLYAKEQKSLNKFVTAYTCHNQIAVVENYEDALGMLGFQFHPESFLTTSSAILAEGLKFWFRSF